jgi:hypothetical protein
MDENIHSSHRLSRGQRTLTAKSIASKKNPVLVVEKLCKECYLKIN